MKFKELNSIQINNNIYYRNTQTSWKLFFNLLERKFFDVNHIQNIDLGQVNERIDIENNKFPVIQSIFILNKIKISNLNILIENKRRLDIIIIASLIFKPPNIEGLEKG